MDVDDDQSSAVSSATSAISNGVDRSFNFPSPYPPSKKPYEFSGNSLASVSASTVTPVAASNSTKLKKSLSVATSISPETRTVRFATTIASQTEPSEPSIDYEYVDHLEHRCEELEAYSNETEKALELAENEIKSLHSELKLREELIASKNEEINLKNQEIGALNGQAICHNQSISQENNSKAREQDALLHKIKDLQGQLELKNQQLSNSVFQTNSLINQLENKDRQLKSLEDQLKLKSEQKTQSDARIVVLEKSFAEVSKKLEDLKNKIHQERGWKNHF